MVTRDLAKVETAGSSPVYRFRLKVSKQRIYAGFGIFSLKEDNINVSNGYGRGVKSKAAKIAAKAMLKKLKHIGAKAFEKAIRKAAKKLPKAAAEKVEKYLTYQKVSAVLNIAANAEGTITDAIQHALQKLGIPKTFARIGARLIVFVLF